MSQKCTNPFLEADGFCTACGKNHFHTDTRGNVVTTPKTRKSNKREKLQAEKSAAIEQNIQSNPQFRTAREMVELLSEIYEIPVKVVFRNRRASYHRKNRDGSHSIVFGYESLNRSYEVKFDEYQSIAWVIGYQEISGIDGVKQEAMHEFAHVLQTEIPGGRTYGSVHNNTFVKCYQEVMELVN